MAIPADNQNEGWAGKDPPRTTAGRRMRYFIEQSTIPNDSRIHVRSYPSYLELSAAAGDASEPALVTWYLLPADEYTYLVVASFGHQLDPLVEVLLDRGIGMAEARMAVLAKRVPTFVRLLTNMTTERYSDGALLYLRDPDDADMKWCVATVVGNVTTQRGPALSEDERIHSASLVVINESIALLSEFSEARISFGDKARLWARLARVTVEESLDTGPSVLAAAQWLGKFVGAG